MNIQKDIQGLMAGVILGLLIMVLSVPAVAQEGGQGVVPLRKVAVLPFLTIEPHAQDGAMVKGLVGDFFFRTGDLPGRAGSELTSLVHHQLLQLGRCEVITVDQVTRAIEWSDPEAFRRDPLSEGVRIGTELKAHAVVIGGVYRFEQRIGSALGVQRPASVAFDAHLVRVADRKVLWSGRFDETQRSLSENLLKADTFVKGGGQWVMVEKLASIGVETVLRTFPSLIR